MNQIANAAPDHASCDACGEPNRTGDSIVYVSEEWCQRHGLEWFEGLKLCIWCRVTMVQGGGVRKTRKTVRRKVKRAKKWHTRKQHAKETLSSWKTKLRQLIST